MAGLTDDEDRQLESLPMAHYRTRMRLVLEAERGGPPVAHCRAKGRHHAICVRAPNHLGICEGPGFDEWGPMYVAWARTRSR